MSDDGSGGGTLEAGAGIDIATGNGRSTITNVGVRRLIAGSGITLSSETGNITISSSGGSGTADIAGTIKIWGGATEPTDWMFCDGRAISRTEYVSLFSRIGTAFGAGDGSSTFNIPDFRNRTAVGSSATKARGSTGALDYAPIGSVVAWTATGAIPNGWLLCNGSTSSRTTEAALFAVIGTTYNTGGESSTVFRLPDYRAMFLRGLDEGRGIDPLRALNGPVPFQKGTLHWSDCGDSPGSAPGDTGIYAFTSGVDYQSSAPYHGSTVKNVGKDSFGAVKNLYSAAYIATEFTYAGAGFAAKTTSPTGRPIVINTGFTSPSTNTSPQRESALDNQQFPDGYYGRDFVWGITRPHNMAVRYIIKARPTTTESDVGYQSAPYIIKVNDNGTQRSGSGGGDTSRAGDVKWVAYAPNNFPPGWQLCDGSELLRAAYPALFARIGTTYGAGNGTTTFNVPDLRGRFIASETAGATGANRASITRGGVGGSADAVVVSHTHEVSDPGHTHSVQTIALQTVTGGPAVATQFSGNNITGSAVTGISIQSSGESGTGKNLPPYVGMVAMIKLDDDTVNTGGIIQAGPGISITTSGSYATISSTISQNPVVAGPGITVQNAPGGAFVSANVRNIVPASGSSITVTNNNGVFEIGGGGGGGGGIAAYGTIIRTGGTIPVNPPGSGAPGTFTASLPASVQGQNVTVGPIQVAGQLSGGSGLGSSLLLTYTFTQQITFSSALPNTNYTVDADAAYTSTSPVFVSNYFPVNDLGINIINKTVNGFQIQYSYYFTASAGQAASGLVWNTAGHPQVRFQVVNNIGGGGGGDGTPAFTGATWQTVSKVAGTTYTNNTGQPLQVSISALLSSGPANYPPAAPGVPYQNWFFVNDQPVAQVGGSIGGGAIPPAYVYAIVPPGGSYRLASITGVSNIVWRELSGGTGGGGGGGGSGLGYNQTWQNVTASRSRNTDYTNTTGSPIQVNVSFIVNQGYSASLLVNNVVVGRVVDSGNYEVPTFGFVSAVVPPGSTYRASTDFGAIDYWAELS
jgi:microcystin-dependent protein